MRSRPTSSSRTTSWPSRRSRPAAGRGSASCRAIPMEMKDPAIAPFSSGLSRWRTRLAGRSSSRGPPDARRHVDGLRRVLPRARRDRASPTGSSGPEFIAESPYLNLYSYPAEADYERDGPARADVAPPRLDGPRARHDLEAAGAAGRAGRGVDLPLPGVARLGGRGADAAPRRPARDDRAPGHRLEGPARRPDHAPRQPGRARRSCRSRRSCRRSTSSSPTAATTPSPRRSTTASR